MIDINEIVRSFFWQFPLRSTRQAERLQLLLQATSLMVSGEHLTPKGLKAILEIREQMISNRQRTYKITDVVTESSETTRQTSVLTLR